jgi:hypothetical protein
MARIDLSQFCEPVAARLHGRLLLCCGRDDTTMMGPRRRLVVQAAFVASSSIPLIPDPRSYPARPIANFFLEATFLWKHQ